MNSLLIFGPIGMISVGLISILVWKLRSHVGVKYFFFGGAVWIVAIIPKLVMDYTVTPFLSSWAATTYGLAGTAVIVGIYIGIRTGIFECGFTYLAFSKSKLKQMSLDEITAFGIGFGAFEAILIAVPSLLQMAVLIFNPSLLELLPPNQRQLVEAQLSLPTWVVPAPIMERALTLFAHLFAALLVFSSVIQQKLSFFFGAFLYKSLLDALVPYLQATLNLSVSPTGIYLVEVWVAIMGLTALVGTCWIRKTLNQHQQSRTLV